jgi:5-bromo-4-chloroindolyl phosphate hydrolysis protein
MITDDQLQELYSKNLAFVDSLCGEYGAMEVAAIMMTQALTIYKSALSDEDYNNMVDSISNSRNKVKTFEKAVLQ